MTELEIIKPLLDLRKQAMITLQCLVANQPAKLLKVSDDKQEEQTESLLVGIDNAKSIKQIIELVISLDDNIYDCCGYERHKGQ